MDVASTFALQVLDPLVLRSYSTLVYTSDNPQPRLTTYRLLRLSRGVLCHCDAGVLALSHTESCSSKEIIIAVAVTTYEHTRVRKTPTQSTKPFTDGEFRARSDAETYFYLARNYATCGDNLNAISCCIEALISTTGITRPLTD